MDHLNAGEPITMSAPANRLATGILPDPVIRTPDANAYLLTVTLNEQLTLEGVQAWLTEVTGLVNTLQTTIEGGQRVATVNMAFAASFFSASGGAPRFGLTPSQVPAGLATPPSLPALAGVPAVAGDVLFYIMSTSEEAVKAKTEGEQEAVIGRRKPDGSRLDLPAGTPIAQEEEFQGDACPVSAHVRKAGPRGTLHDESRIFRRGVPYLTLNSDGTEDAGLQFVSYQRSLEEFAVIFTRWITNPNFPQEGAGPDALLADGLITIEKAGFFFSPPSDRRYIGASMFDSPPVDPCAFGHIVVQKQLVDANNAPVLSELGNIEFQVLREGQNVGAAFKTDSTGRAVSPPVPRDTALVVHEVAPPQGFQQAPDTAVNLAKARELVTIGNHRSPEGPGPVYTG
jgi:deferrochelatase/peroxidase EfeB